MLYQKISCRSWLCPAVPKDRVTSHGCNATHRSTQPTSATSPSTTISVLDSMFLRMTSTERVAMGLRGHERAMHFTQNRNSRHVEPPSRAARSHCHKTVRVGASMRVFAIPTASLQSVLPSKVAAGSSSSSKYKNSAEPAPSDQLQAKSLSRLGHVDMCTCGERNARSPLMPYRCLIAYTKRAQKEYDQRRRRQRAALVTTQGSACSCRRPGHAPPERHMRAAAAHDRIANQSHKCTPPSRRPQR